LLRYDRAFFLLKERIKITRQETKQIKQLQNPIKSTPQQHTIQKKHELKQFDKPLTRKSSNYQLLS